jgi:hypothetical protein
MRQNRKYQRFPVELSVYVTGGGSSVEREVILTEISSRGGILTWYADTRLPITTGQTLVCEVELVKKQTLVPVVIKVKWVKRSAEAGAACRAGFQIMLIKKKDREKLLELAYRHVMKSTIEA